MAAEALKNLGGQAVFAAAALGDLGKLFPDTSAEYKNIDSMLLLDRVCALLKEKNFTIGNIDATVIAQAPKLAPHISGMRDCLARHCGISVEQVSVKATTEEHLGFTGSGEGIAAHAVCLIETRN